MSLREEFFKAYIGALCQLRVLTPGLSKIASEEAAKALMEKHGLKAEGSLREALSNLFSTLNVEAGVEIGDDGVKVRIQRPCPFSWPGCENLCPLPHISSFYLTSLGKWFPKRVGASFVEVTQDACSFFLVKSLKVSEGSD